MQKNLPDILKGKTVIVGIGNTLRGDDGAGPALIAQVAGKVKAVCIDAGTSPENYAGKITQQAPDTILLVDALHLECEAGAYEILTKDEILNSGFSTHDLSPRMFIEYLEQQTQAEIYLLGIQPQTIAFGQEISPEVKQAIEQISTQIQNKCMRHI
ncbi:hydrogenase maturation peptidase HycI [Candidatus Omnitrophota bacterium]